MNNIQVGDIIKAKVTSVKNYGAFIETKNKTQGLIHISEISNNFIIDVNYYLKVGQIVEVKVLSIVDGKINASLNFNNVVIDRKSKIKNFGKMHNSCFKYGFSTIQNNIKKWQKDAMDEIQNNPIIK